MTGNFWKTCTYNMRDAARVMFLDIWPCVISQVSQKPSMLEMHGRSWRALPAIACSVHSSSANTAVDFLLLFYVQPCVLLVIAALFPYANLLGISGVRSCVQ